MTQQRLKIRQLKLDFETEEGASAETFEELGLSPSDLGKVTSPLLDLKYMSVPMSLAEYAGLSGLNYILEAKRI